LRLPELLLDPEFSSPELESSLDLGDDDEDEKDEDCDDESL